MKKRKVLIFGLLVLCLIGCNNNISENREKASDVEGPATKAGDSLVFKLEKVADGLYGPLALENAHDGSGRIFIAEQAGRIMILKKGELLKEPFLNIRSLLVPMENKYMDVGILGFAFHPD